MTLAVHALRSNAPHVPRGRLVGRKAERAVARTLLLYDAVPLVTLAGPGGVGKTRLAQTIVQDLAEHYADGVVWVDLAPVGDAALVLSTIAHALGLRLSNEQPDIETLATALRQRAPLLALDNVEHLLPAATALAALLSRCPRLQLLATSLEAHSLSGEHVLPIPPLQLPAPADVRSAQAVAASEAARLFLDRARAVRHEFTPTDANAAVVAAICQRLDGLPLAIELAGARVAHLPPAELLRRLEPHLPLLTGGPRDLPPRLQTMRDAIQWSYDLLSPAEQAVFRRLAVFVGGFTLEAAEAVVGNAVLDPIASLVAKSLLQASEGPGGKARYRMLETIREFGLERLAESADGTWTRGVSAAYFLAFAERHHPNRVNPVERVEERVQRIETDLPNLRAALVWFAEQGKTERQLRLSAALAVFWHLRGHFEEGRLWLERALGAASDVPTLPRGQALAGLALLMWAQSRYEEAVVAANTSLAIADRHGDVELSANALHVLGMVAEIQDDWAVAEPFLARAREQWHALDAKAEEAWALTLLCRVARGLGDRVLTTRHAEQALELFHDVGHPAGEATALARLAEIARGQGHDRRASQAYQEALHIWDTTGDRWLITLALAGLADLAAAHDQAAEAATLVGFLDAAAEAAGAPLLSAARLSRDRALAGAAAHLGASRCAAMQAAGRLATREEAVAVAAAVAVPGPRSGAGIDRTDGQRAGGAPLDGQDAYGAGDRRDPVSQPMYRQRPRHPRSRQAECVHPTRCRRAGKSNVRMALMDFDVTPQRTALLTIDMQNLFVAGYAASAPDGLATLDRINRLAAVCRDAGAMVIHARHVLRPDGANMGILGELYPAVRAGLLRQDATPTALHPGLVVDPRDLLLDKPRYGAFYGTDVELILRTRGIDTTIIAGIATNICCDTTAREAMVRDFRVIFLSDGTATSDSTDPAAETLQAATLATQMTRLAGC